MRRHLLPARAIEPALDDIEIGEDALDVERLEVAQRIGRRLDRGIRKIAQHETERVLLPNLLQRLDRQPLLLGAVLPGNVAEADLGVRGLLGRKDLGQRVDAYVGDVNRAESHLAAESHRHVEPRHRVEDGRLPGARKADQSHFHGAVEILRTANTPAASPR